MPRHVALKVMKCDSSGRDSLAREVEKRQDLDPTKVLPLLRVHVPQLQQEMDFDGAVPVEVGDPGEYVLVMQWADATLSDELRFKQIAGINFEKVRGIAKDVAQALRAVHDNGKVHGMYLASLLFSVLKLITGDVKPRNIVNVQDSWCLIDFDAAGSIGEQLTGKRGSEAYMAPGCMRVCLRDGSEGSAARQEPMQACIQQDIFSFGVMLFELCTATSFFVKDVNNDNLVHQSDKQVTEQALL